MDAEEKSFETVAETSKLLISLCTAVTAFGVTVTNIKVGDAVLFTPSRPCDKAMLLCSWLILLLSIGCGVWTQLGVAHVLSKKDEVNPFSIWNAKIRIPQLWQIGSFLIGLILLLIYAFALMFG